MVYGPKCMRCLGFTPPAVSLICMAAIVCVCFVCGVVNEDKVLRGKGVGVTTLSVNTDK